jgi:Ankyrin repeats (3 copies)
MRFPRPFLLPLALFMSACGHFGEESFPPLIAAARGGDAAAIRALIRQGADPNLRAGHHPWPALMHAVHTNRPQAVLALLDEGADPNGATPTGITVLMMAAGYGRAAMVRELLRRGADPRRTSPGGVSALSTAVGGVPDIDRFTAGQCQTGYAPLTPGGGPGPEIAGHVERQTGPPGSPGRRLLRGLSDAGWARGRGTLTGLYPRSILIFKKCVAQEMQGS